DARRGLGPLPPVARRTLVRTAAVGLVLAGDAARYQSARVALLAFALGFDAAAPAGPGRLREPGRVAARLCDPPPRATDALGRAHDRSRRRGALSGFGCGRRRRDRR